MPLEGGQRRPKGSWALQSMPSHTGWKLLIQKEMAQSPMQAAMTYNPANDIARIDLQQAKTVTPLETLAMWLVPSRQPGPPHGDLVIGWGTVMLSTQWVVK